MAVLVSSLFLFENVYASTSVIGIITTDTIWTKAGSPYQLTGPTAVGQGVTLTIEPGASVDLGDYYLEVNGTLIAKGTSSENVVISATTKMGTYYNKKILFSNPSIDWNEQTGAGSIIENAVLNCVSIWINDASPKIANNHFKDTSYNILLTVNGGSPVITGNEMVFNGNGFDCPSGSPTFSGNVLTNGGGLGNWGIRARNIVISNNIISGLDRGIIAYENGALTITGNAISGASFGIDTLKCPATITGNSITNCGTAVLSGGTVTNNLITNNKYGIKEATDSSAIHYNNLVNNLVSVYISGSHDIDATNNYWGTTNETAIAQSIHDNKFNYNLGTVNFKPFLTEQVETGYVEPTPIPTTSWSTPSPTQTSLPQSTTSASTKDQNSFNIESNSTVSAFAFDVNIPQISFIVSGPEETFGYVKLTIAKTFMPNSSIMVYLDGSQISYDLSSNSNSWIVTFTYHHSSHQIIVNSSENPETTGIPSGVLNTATALTAAGIAVAVVLLSWRKMKVY
jgi:hypothetical protein